MSAHDSVANQGAKSARLEMLLNKELDGVKLSLCNLTVRRGSPATIGLGGTLRPSLTSNSRDILIVDIE